MKNTSLVTFLLIGFLFVASVVKANSEGECTPGADKECGLHKQCVKNETAKNTYYCACKPGYEPNGDNCKDLDECKKKATRLKCKQKGAKCKNFPGSYECKCPRGYEMHPTKHQCEDYDECEDEPCHEKAVCQNKRGSYTCTCVEGFAGDGYECVEDMAYKQKQKIQQITMIGGAAGGGALLIIALIACCCCVRKRKRKENDEEKIEKEPSTLSEYGQDWESSEDSEEEDASD